MEGLRSGEAAIHHPLRVVHTEERQTRRQRIDRHWVQSTTERSWWWATTIPQDIMPMRQIAQVGHGRWGIENECFNQLSAHWSLDHCFYHQPAAILNSDVPVRIILTGLIAFVLLEAFYRLHLKPSVRERFTLKARAQELFLALPRALAPKAPWLDGAPRPP